ncbi:DNA polymerase III subunit delta [Patescibacteria group bacterium]|nr:DNA polymerase III subunit delta [Patescibacteria group bacterium]
MTLFIHGTEPYRIREQLRSVIERAQKSGTDESGIVRVDGSTAKLGNVRESLSSGSLFSTGKKLVIISDWLANHNAADNEELAELLKDTSKETIVAVVESIAPDKRQKATKLIEKSAERSWSFEPLDEAAARRWVVAEADRRKTKLSPALANQLVRAAGTDLWTLSTEIDKLAAAASGKKEITLPMIEQLVMNAEEGNVWQLVDGLSKGDTKSAIKNLNQLIDDGEAPLKIFGMIVRQYRILLGVKSMEASSDAAIAKQLGIHPFAAKQARRFTGRFSEEDLLRAYDELAELDIQMKTGRRDPETALELFVAERTTALA